MKLYLTAHVDVGGYSKSNIINDLNNDFELYFENKCYDENLEQILVGIIAIENISGYEHWYKPRKPKYILYEKKKDPIFKGKTYEISKTYECEFRLSEDDYNRFISEPESISKIILGTYILETLSDLNYLCKKVKDFKKEEFINDLTICLKENTFLE
jgi:hypothetical protein